MPNERHCECCPWSHECIRPHLIGPPCPGLPLPPEVQAEVEAARGLIRYVKENHPEWIGTRKDWYKQIDDALAALDRAQRKP